MLFCIIAFIVIVGMGSIYLYFRQYQIRLKKLEDELQASLAAQHKLEDISRRNEIIINNTNSGLAYITSDYIVQWENFSTCSADLQYEIYKKGELCYKSAYNKSEPCENCLLQKVMASKQIEQKSFTLPNGKSIEVLGNPLIQPNGEIGGIIIRVDDITERQEMIQNLKIAKEKAEESDRLKTAFLANMSHEIRTPLNAIIGFSNLLTQAELPEERKHFSKIILKNNDLLLQLINDIFDLSKIESGIINFHPQEINISEFFNEIAVSFRYKMPNDIEFLCELPHESCIVILDPSQLRKIVINFMNNAIKFTPKGRIILGYEIENNGIKCYVSDTGIGVEKENFSIIFNRFEKLNKFVQGTGLGLSICKAIVDAYGGNIGLNSEKGKGSTFWAWLPCPMKR